MAERASKTEAALIEAKRELWYRGCPGDYLRDNEQQQWHKLLWANPAGVVGKVARRRGKSFFAVSECVELALATEGAFIDYLAQTGGAAEGIVRPAIDLMLEFCPAELAPKFYAQAQLWEFPSTGAVLTVSGVDNEQYRRKRGRSSHLVVYDECAFYADLAAVEAVFDAQLLSTGGRRIWISSPPENPGHLFVQRYKAALAEGRAFSSTVYDNPRMSRSQVDSFLSRQASARGQTLEEFKSSTYCRREYFADILAEETKAAIPSFTMERAKAIVGDFQRPQYFDAYVSLDFGWGDGHGALFAVFDFERQQLLVEDAVHVRQATIAKFQAIVKERETALWGVDRFDGSLYGAKDFKESLPDFLRDAIRADAPRQPFVRVGDDQMLLLSELRSHGLAVIPTKKDDKHLRVDAVNNAMARGEILIHSRATKLVEHLYTTTWNNQRTQWERTDTHHGELVDCLVYMYRNLRRHNDPRPPQPMNPWDRFQQRAETTHSLKTLIGLGRR